MKQKKADEVKEMVKNNHNNLNMVKSGIQGLQGPRPAPLKICKDSHKIPVTRRPPVIIYTRSPEVIHTQPQDFSKLVQRLTGSTTSNPRKSHRSRMKAQSNHEGQSSQSQVVLEPSTCSLDQNHEDFNCEDFSSREKKELMPAEYTNINDPVKIASNISVSNNLDIAAAARDHEYSDNFMQQILSSFGLQSPAFTLNPSLSPNFFPISPSPGWVLKSSDISPCYTLPLEYSSLFSNFPTNAPYDNIFGPPHVRPPTSSSKDSFSDPFNRIP